MKPISRGRGPEKYTLFFPYSIRDGVESFDKNLFLTSLRNCFPNEVSVDHISDKGVDILKISGFDFYDEGVNAFNVLKRLFLYLAIESDAAIYIRDSLININEPFAHFPASWSDGIKAGWEADEKDELIKIDGIAHIKDNPRDAVREMYKIRSKVAHSATLGTNSDEKVHRSIQFAHCTAKALLKKQLGFV